MNDLVNGPMERPLNDPRKRQPLNAIDNGAKNDHIQSLWNGLLNFKGLNGLLIFNRPFKGLPFIFTRLCMGPLTSASAVRY